MGAQEPEYQDAISGVEAKKSHKEIESGKELERWGVSTAGCKLYQTPKGKLIVVGSLDPKIYVPKGYREKAIKDLHQSGRKAAAVIAILRLHYT